MDRDTSRSIGFFWNFRRVESSGGKSLSANLCPVNDAFSETINFRFEFDGSIYRGLISHAALRERFAAVETEDGAMNAFIRNALFIVAISRSRVRTAQSGLVTIESGDI
jgi:hypothetical protein